jgi:hypothetical protein
VIRGLSGHSINPYQIHGSKSIGLVRSDDPARMEEGEYYAIETFGSTGRGLVVEQGECSHYARAMAPPRVPLRCARTAPHAGCALTRAPAAGSRRRSRCSRRSTATSARSPGAGATSTARARRTTCSRFARPSEARRAPLTPAPQLNHLVSQGIVEQYLPLYDMRGSMTAQFVRPPCVSVRCGIADACGGYRSTRFFFAQRARRSSAAGTIIEAGEVRFAREGRVRYIEQWQLLGARPCSARDLARRATELHAPHTNV